MLVVCFMSHYECGGVVFCNGVSHSEWWAVCDGGVVGERLLHFTVLGAVGIGAIQCCFASIQPSACLLPFLHLP